MVLSSHSKNAIQTVLFPVILCVLYKLIRSVLLVGSSNVLYPCSFGLSNTDRIMLKYAQNMLNKAIIKSAVWVIGNFYGKVCMDKAETLEEMLTDWRK